MNDYSNVILVLYTLSWVFTLLWYQKKKHYFDAGSIIIISYIAYSLVSIVLYNSPFAEGMYNEMKAFPFIYLYIMLMMALSPISTFNANRVKYIRQPNARLLNFFCWVVIITTFLLIPFYMQRFQEGLVALLIDSSAGVDLYVEAAENAGTTGSGISNLTSIISGSLADITIFLFFYYLLLPNKNKIIIILLFISFILRLLSPLAGGGRGMAVSSMLTIFVTFFMFRPFYPPKTRKMMNMVGILIIIIVSIPFMALTLSRFGQKDGGLTYSNADYLGQANLNFNNYGLDAGGIRYGDRTFNLLKRMVDPSAPKNYVERRNKYPHLKMDDTVFYTFVGDFTLDFGPILAFVLFLLFFTWANQVTRIRGETVQFHQLLLCFFVACVSAQGGFVLFSYSDTNGLKMIMLFVFYFLTASSARGDKIEIVKV